MGTFEAKIGIGHPHGGDLWPAAPLVGTGAVHSMMPESLLQDLRLAPLERVRFTLADGSAVHYGFGEARFEIEGRQMTCPVIFGPEGQYLLGATTLEIFNLTADTTNRWLIPVERLTL